MEINPRIILAVVLTLILAFMSGMFIGITTQSTRTVYLDEKMKQCDQAGGDYHVSTWKDNHNIYCDLPTRTLFDINVTK